MQRTHLNIAEARRIALAAQGFDRQRPNSTPDVRHFRRVVETLGLLQIDYVNVLMPAHFLVLWSRLGAYDRSRFEKTMYRSGRFTEQWAHEASIVPVSTWPLLEHRRQCWKPTLPPGDTANPVRVALSLPDPGRSRRTDRLRGNYLRCSDETAGEGLSRAPPAHSGLKMAGSKWRRGGDLNPRYRSEPVQRISNPPLSAAQPPLRSISAKNLPSRPGSVRSPMFHDGRTVRGQVTPSPSGPPVTSSRSCLST